MGENDKIEWTDHPLGRKGKGTEEWPKELLVRELPRRA